jgi:hypothetical protein
VQQRGDVSQQAPQQVAQTLRVACHVMQNLEAPFCLQRRTLPFCYKKRAAFKQMRPNTNQIRRCTTTPVHCPLQGSSTNVKTNVILSPFSRIPPWSYVTERRWGSRHS